MQINNKAKIRVWFVFQPAAASTIMEDFKTSEGILQVLFKDSLWYSVVAILNSLTMLPGKLYHVIMS